ncbi:MAG: hypothetical protein AAF447_28335, partial [Myxococcota bacterium]
VLLLLAFDVVVDFLPHGGRYGIGAFNVAHFPWLDALQPVPTPALYVGLCVLLGVLAAGLGLGRPTRTGQALLCLLFTWSWAMSMLDSYQHHYLLSWVLLAMVAFPRLRAQDLTDPALPGSRPAPSGDVAAGGVLFAVGVGLALLEAAKAPFAFLTLFDLLGRAGGVLALLSIPLLGALLMGRAEATPSGGNATVARVPAWPLLLGSCATVYLWTAVAKLEPDWQSGAALGRLAKADLEALAAQVAGPGLPLLGPLPRETFFSHLATATVALQLVTVVALVAVVAQDRLATRWKRVAVRLLGLAPLAFHLGAERIGLKIGWFSYYMLLLVVVAFAPASWLRAFAAGVARLEARREGASERWLLLGVLALLAMGAVLDVPGAQAASVVAAVGLVASGAVARWRQRRRQAGDWGRRGLLAAALVTLALVNSEARFDYYRFVGGDHRRRDELEAALVAYEKANRYNLRPFCVTRGRRDVECFGELFGGEERAALRARELGSGYATRRRDRQRQEAEVRALLGR